MCVGLEDPVVSLVYHFIVHSIWLPVPIFLSYLFYLVFEIYSLTFPSMYASYRLLCIFLVV